MGADNALPFGTNLQVAGTVADATFDLNGHNITVGNIDMAVELIQPVAMEEGVTFAIREGGKTVGAGVVAFAGSSHWILLSSTSI